jgi:DNA topoisomerase I-like protein
MKSAPASGTSIRITRRQINDALRADDKASAECVAAGAVRLLDLGLVRVGGEESVDEFGHYGLATLTARHLEFHDGRAVFDDPAKSGVRRTLCVLDPEIVALLRRLRAGRSGPPATHLPVAAPASPLRPRSRSFRFSRSPIQSSSLGASETTS